MVNFDRCAVDFQNSRNQSLYGYNHTGPGFSGERPVITYKGCKLLCGNGVDAFSWSGISSTITTWVFPVIGILLQGPFESNKSKATLLALIRWIGSPVSSLSYILWNIKVSGKAALMVDMATKYEDRPGKESTFSNVRDSFYILSVMNQYTINPEMRWEGEAPEKLLRIALFDTNLRIDDKSMVESRRETANVLRQCRRRGVVSVFISMGWFLFSLGISIQAAFSNIGPVEQPDSLGLGLMLGWIPVLILCSIVDRNPADPEAVENRLNKFLHDARESSLARALEEQVVNGQTSEPASPHHTREDQQSRRRSFFGRGCVGGSPVSERNGQNQIEGGTSHSFSRHERRQNPPESAEQGRIVSDQIGEPTSQTAFSEVDYDSPRGPAQQGRAIEHDTPAGPRDERHGATHSTEPQQEQIADDQISEPVAQVISRRTGSNGSRGQAQQENAMERGTSTYPGDGRRGESHSTASQQGQNAEERTRNPSDAHFDGDFFVGFGGQGRRRWHYGVAYTIVAGIEDGFVKRHGRNWLQVPGMREKLVDIPGNSDGIFYFDVRELWQIASSLAVVVGTVFGAFILNYFTPPVGLGCRSGGYLIFCVWVTGIFVAELVVWWWTSNSEGDEFAARETWERWFFVPAEILSVCWLLYIITAQTVGLYQNCWCSTWGGWFDFETTNFYDPPFARSYWVGALCLSLIVMCLSFAFIIAEWCTQSHLATADFEKAMNGLERTRAFKWATSWIRNVVDFVITKAKRIVFSQERKSLVWKRDYT
ncbi:hypothetical protein FGG08_005665 [Glutinoglossum americanum]|uniref:Uncharacterized protein n=1 Tax=Glutinoglossum americanum TaxID=1670608 RepID=A0A9P8I2V2_9PEZI|nr:hypothetical protein FGG08_005665 [Glutinoglossum americanum]